MPQRLDDIVNINIFIITVVGVILLTVTNQNQIIVRTTFGTLGTFGNINKEKEKKNEKNYKTSLHKMCLQQLYLLFFTTFFIVNCCWFAVLTHFTSGSLRANVNASSCSPLCSKQARDNGKKEQQLYV